MFGGDSTGSSLPHAVDARRRVVYELEEGDFHVLDVDARQVHHGGEGIEVHDDATLTVYGCDVLGGQTSAHGVPPPFKATCGMG